ncbi:hypothetical protein BDP27DRAFT_1407675 [Rhodocollybia butyracea]|uniref:Uncharacterized protein n=1 Tax=Rhodocollybia butyracea TaxID=206335 RepID=A0A9P5PAQ7_9AGAR|nr:hypothetical protein BDP27DRAFT_1407675 [Rhodocollybia butyracea]
MHIWISYMVKTYTEPLLPFYDSEDDSFGMRALRTVILVYLELLSKGVIRIQELESTPGAADMVVRVQIYGLCVYRDGPSSSAYYEVSARLLDMMSSDWDNFWSRVHEDTLTDISIPASTALIKVLTRLCQKRPLAVRYRDLSRWLYVFSYAGPSQTFLQQLMKRRSVYFVTRILTRIGKNMESTQGQNILNDANVLDTWKFAVQHLLFALDYGGHDAIVLSLELGLFSTLWSFSQVCGDSLLGDYTVGELYGAIVGIVAAASLYRTVLKALQKGLQKHPLRNRALEWDQVQAHSVPIWREFKKAIRSAVSKISLDRASGSMLRTRCCTKRQKEFPAQRTLEISTVSLLLQYMKWAVDKTNWQTKMLINIPFEALQTEITKVP